MHLSHGTSIFLTDGRKALLLRNAGDSRFPDLKLEQKWEQDLAPDRDLKSDAPGRAFSSYGEGSRRSAYSEPDYHRAAEAHFVTNLIAVLHERCLKGDIRALVIAAPPRALGDVRKALTPQIGDLVIAELAKDLVKHPLTEIERILASWENHIQPA